jgi:anaerobic selenocysteine-containing dehydrogenase
MSAALRRESGTPLGERFNPPLQVVGFIATRKGDPERGPLVRMNANEAKTRLLEHGELVWIHGPRRHELATLEIDEALPRGGVVVRDVLGLAVTEIVRVVKPDLDTPRDPRVFA